MPFYHCFGMVMGNLACTTHGAAIVIPAPGFDPAATLAAVQDERCTSLYGVPTMFIAELALPGFADYDLSHAAHRHHGRLAVPGRGDEARGHRDAHGRGDDLLRDDRDLAGVDPDPADDDLERGSSTVGRVHPHLEVKVVDPETGLVVPRGQPGELCTRGYSVMLGYWDEPDKTAEAIDAARWMHTGDLADDGRGRLPQHRRPDQGHGDPRRRERLPARDRGVPLRHPDIDDVQVIGVPDAKYGEELCAWVAAARRRADRRGRARLLHRQDRALQGARATCRFVDEFPMTVTGKMRKFKMRETSVAELGLDAADQQETA